mmetsp:Transcript_87106/g.227242  ORF Transcript_87106/g.227242 Transcript_87106/m.227242 type:complete len:421 (+) Transcript_87106:15-1277(+)
MEGLGFKTGPSSACFSGTLARSPTTRRPRATRSTRRACRSRARRCAGSRIRSCTACSSIRSPPSGAARSSSSLVNTTSIPSSGLRSGRPGPPTRPSRGSSRPAGCSPSREARTRSTRSSQGRTLSRCPPSATPPISAASTASAWRRSSARAAAPTRASAATCRTQTGRRRFCAIGTSSWLARPCRAFWCLVGTTWGATPHRSSSRSGSTRARRRQGSCLVARWWQRATWAAPARSGRSSHLTPSSTRPASSTGPSSSPCLARRRLESSCRASRCWTAATSLGRPPRCSATRAGAAWPCAARARPSAARARPCGCCCGAAAGSPRRRCLCWAAGRPLRSSSSLRWGRCGLAAATRRRWSSSCRSATAPSGPPRRWSWRRRRSRHRSLWPCWRAPGGCCARGTPRRPWSCSGPAARRGAVRR